MRRAIDETERRRNKQKLFNQQNNITPRGVSKRIKDLIDGVYDSKDAAEHQKVAQIQAHYAAMDETQLAKEIQRLEKAMLTAAKSMEFEQAAQYRDEIKNLKNKLFIGMIDPTEIGDILQPAIKKSGKKSGKRLQI